jgi:hypothetical protein
MSRAAVVAACLRTGAWPKNQAEADALADYLENRKPRKMGRPQRLFDRADDVKAVVDYARKLHKNKEYGLTLDEALELAGIQWEATRQMGFGVGSDEERRWQHWHPDKLPFRTIESTARDLLNRSQQPRKRPSTKSRKKR